MRRHREGRFRRGWRYWLPDLIEAVSGVSGDR